MSHPKNYTDELLAAIQEARARAVTIERDVAEIKKRILAGSGTEAFVSLANISNATKDELTKQGWFISADGAVMSYTRPAEAVEAREAPAKRGISLISREVSVDKDNADALAEAERRLESLILQRDSCVTGADKAAIEAKIEKTKNLIALL